MNLSGIKNSTFVGKLLRLPLSLIPATAVVPILQGPLARRRWIVGAGNHGYWLGSYEYDKQRSFAEKARHASVVFDVGAHVGFYTLLAATCMGARGRVFAFEPLPRNLSYLEKHVELNRLSNVTVLPYAVSDQGGEVHFDVASGSSMGQIAPTGSLGVTAVSLDDLVDAGTIPPPDLMKIDVEGAEVQVLAGAEKVISAARPTIFLATHSADLHRSCCAWLKAHGYRIEPVADDELIAHG